MEQTVPAQSSPLGLRRWLIGAFTLAVAGATIIGSAPELMAIADGFGVPCPWVLPVCLDGVGISAAIALHGTPRDKFSWVTLLAAAGTSTAIRVSAAPDDPVAWVVFAAQGIAAPVAVHQFVRVTTVAPERKKAQPKPSLPRVPVIEGDAAIVPEGRTSRRTIRGVDTVGPRSDQHIPAGVDGAAVDKPQDGGKSAATFTDAERVAGPLERISHRSLGDALRAERLTVSSSSIAEWVDLLKRESVPPRLRPDAAGPDSDLPPTAQVTRPLEVVR